MYQNNNEDVRYPATIFDKLSRGVHSPGEQVSYNLEELKASIRENIELILNTRSQVSIIESAELLHKNNIYYLGISDYYLQNLSDQAVAEEFKNEAKNAVENFEPRLKNVKVSFALDSKNYKKSSYHLKIEAELAIQDLHINKSDLAFNTTLIPIKRIFDIDIAK